MSAAFIRWFVALLLLAVGLWQGPLNLVGSELQYLPGDHIDNRFNHYILEHGYRWLNGQERSFWQSRFCFPARWMTTGSENHLGTLPLYAACRKFGADPERAFQLWYLGLTALNYVGCYWGLRKLGLSALAAVAGSYLFAFGLPMMGQVTHIQMVPRFLVPMAVACVWRFLWSPSWVWLTGATACLVGQIYCNMYIGLFSAMLIAAVMLATVVVARKVLPWKAIFRPGRAEWLRRIGGCALPVLAMAYVTVPYLRTNTTYHVLPIAEVLTIAPDVAAWVRPPVESQSWGWLRAILPDRDAVPFVWEKLLFPGAIAYVGVLYGAAQLLRRLRGKVTLGNNLPTCAVVMVAVLLPVPLLFLQVGGTSIYEGLLTIPGIAKLRASGRVILVLLLPLGFLVGCVLEASLRFRYRAIVPLFLIALVLDLQMIPHSDPRWNEVRYPVAHSRNQREAWANAIRKEPRAKVVYAFPPRGTDDFAIYALQVDAMWGAMEAGVPTVNGYTGYTPNDWFYFDNYCDLLHWLRIRGVLTPELLDGVLTFGVPKGNEDREAEREFRAKFLPRAVPLTPH